MQISFLYPRDPDSRVVGWVGLRNLHFLVLKHVWDLLLYSSSKCFCIFSAHINFWNRVMRLVWQTLSRTDRCGLHSHVQNSLCIKQPMCCTPDASAPALATKDTTHIRWDSYEMSVPPPTAWIPEAVWIRAPPPTSTRIGCIIWARNRYYNRPLRFGGSFSTINISPWLFFKCLIYIYFYHVCQINILNTSLFMLWS